jgi:hypothetical protein
MTEQDVVLREQLGPCGDAHQGAAAGQEMRPDEARQQLRVVLHVLEDVEQDEPIDARVLVRASDEREARGRSLGKAREVRRRVVRVEAYDAAAVRERFEQAPPEVAVARADVEDAQGPRARARGDDGREEIRPRRFPRMAIERRGRQLP